MQFGLIIKFLVIQSIKTKISNKTKIYIFISLFIDKTIETEYHLQHFWENNWIVSFQR